MIHLQPFHQKLHDTIFSYLSDATKRQGSCLADSTTIIADYDLLFDFGFRYRLIVHKKGTVDRHQDGYNHVILSLHIGCTDWGKLRESVLKYLPTILGKDAIIMRTTQSVRSDPQNQLTFPSVGSVDDNYDLAIDIDSSRLPSGYNIDTCSELLSKIRVRILGQRLLDALNQLNRNRHEEQNNDLASNTFEIPILRQSQKAKSIYPSCIVSCQEDRVTVVFPVTYLDETERSLAKLFLQQFPQASKASISKNQSMPLCDFRRATEPPREVISFNHETKGQSTGIEKLICDQKADDLTYLAGFISFTLFHIETDEKVTENLIMFLTYLDHHVKSSKSYMYSRMRQNKSILAAKLA